jgi:hypothetical protein
MGHGCLRPSTRSRRHGAAAQRLGDACSPAGRQVSCHGMYPWIIDGHAHGLVSLPWKPLSTPRNSGQARHGFNLAQWTRSRRRTGQGLIQYTLLLDPSPQAGQRRAEPPPLDPDQSDA